MRCKPVGASTVPAAVIMSGMKRKRPKAVVWYEVYCHVFAGLNLLTAWEGLQIARNPHGIIGRFSLLSDLATDQDTLDYLVLMVQVAPYSRWN